jgi:hypothetical protein
LNVTVPVTFVVGLVTLTENVTGSPSADGFLDDRMIETDSWSDDLHNGRGCTLYESVSPL